MIIINCTLFWECLWVADFRDTKLYSPVLNGIGYAYTASSILIVISVLLAMYLLSAQTGEH